MSQNYNLNSSFGFNVSSKNTQNQNKTPQIEQLGKVVGDLFESATSYVSEYEKVFNGEVEKQIDMYARQAMFVGMNLKGSEVQRRFDTSI